MQLYILPNGKIINYNDLLYYGINKNQVATNNQISSLQSQINSKINYFNGVKSYSSLVNKDVLFTFPSNTKFAYVSGFVIGALFTNNEYGRIIISIGDTNIYYSRSRNPSAPTNGNNFFVQTIIDNVEKTIQRINPVVNGVNDVTYCNGSTYTTLPSLTCTLSSTSFQSSNISVTYSGYYFT